MSRCEAWAHCWATWCWNPKRNRRPSARGDRRPGPAGAGRRVRTRRVPLAAQRLAAADFLNRLSARGGRLHKHGRIIWSGARAARCSTSSSSWTRNAAPAATKPSSPNTRPRCSRWSRHLAKVELRANPGLGRPHLGHRQPERRRPGNHHRARSTRPTTSSRCAGGTRARSTSFPRPPIASSDPGSARPRCPAEPGVAILIVDGPVDGVARYQARAAQLKTKAGAIGVGGRCDQPATCPLLRRGHAVPQRS
jgi:hypothetical protein